MEIRELRKQDLPAIAALLSELTYSVQSAPNQEPGEIGSLVKDMGDKPELYANYVAVEQNTLLGLISIVFYQTLFHRGGTALIIELVVSKEHRRRGIGTQLLQRAVTEAKNRGMDEIEVGTENDNTAAQAFYKKK